jgi:hypothetical protein
VKAKVALNLGLEPVPFSYVSIDIARKGSGFISPFKLPNKRGGVSDE